MHGALEASVSAAVERARSRRPRRPRRSDNVCSDRALDDAADADQCPLCQPAIGGMQRPGGLFGGFGRSMIGGLVAGGLLGMLLGHGFGGGFGFLGMLLQFALIGGMAMLAIRYFANRRHSPSYGGAAPSAMSPMASNGNSSFRIPTIGSGAGFGSPAPRRSRQDER
jgi:predicted lipid-binding transport protein (Tim44 family)